MVPVHRPMLAVSAGLLAFAGTAPVLAKDVDEGKTINFINASAVIEP